MNKNNKEVKIQQEENFPDDNYKNQIVQYSPKQRFYRFNEEIGSGSYKSVFRGHDTDTGREIAWNIIKLIRLPTQQRKRIVQEIAILKNIHHNKIINFINAWINKNKNEMIFITEMVCGGSLKKHLRRIKKPRLKIIKGWCKQILQGLNYLHSIKPNPIIHRDIKCQNIFINTNTNEIRIGDLGLAISTKNSYAQTLIGTPQFMAPEILEGRYNTKVDIYAFGMTILEMVTHQIPYRQCKNIHQIYKNIQQRIKPKCIDLIESQSLKKFIQKCLDQQNKRPSAQELLQDEFFIQQQDDNKQVKLKQGISICDSVDYSLQISKQVKKNSKNDQQYSISQANNHRPKLSFKHMNSMQVMLNQRENKPSQQNILLKYNKLQQGFLDNIKKKIQQDFRQSYTNFSSRYNKNIRKQFISTKDFYLLQYNILKQFERREIQEEDRIQEQELKYRKQISVQHTNKKICKTNSSRSSELSKKKKRQNENLMKNNMKSKYTELHLQPQKVYQNFQKNREQLETKSLISSQINHFDSSMKQESFSKNIGSKISFEFKNGMKSSKDIKTQNTKSGEKEEKNLLNCKTQNKIKNSPVLETQSKFYITNNNTTTKKTYQSFNNSQIDQKTYSQQNTIPTLINRLFNSSNQKQINSEYFNQSLKSNNQKKQVKLQQQTKNNIKENNFLTESATSKRSDMLNPNYIKINLKNSKKESDLAAYEEFNKEINFLTKIKKEVPKLPISKDNFIKQDVILIQNIMSKIMDQKIEIIGVYGFYTEQLIKKFQRKHNLTPNGIVDLPLYSIMIEQLQKKFNLIDKQKQLKEKSQELEKIKRLKNQESNNLLTQLQSQILKRQNSH